MPAGNYTQKVSFVSGIVNAGDAISETILAELEAIDRIARRERRNIDARVFCAASNIPDPRIVPLGEWKDILHHEHFLVSDSYLFHFGIYSPMHQALAFARRDAWVSVFFHNVTQPQYLPRAAEALIHRSYQQIELLRLADEHFAASQFSADQLRSYGLARSVSVVPLFGPNAAATVGPVRPVPSADRPIQLAYCGRFVPAKGILPVLEALGGRPEASQMPLAITLAGFEEHSDPAYLSSLFAMAEQLKGRIEVDILLNLSGAMLTQVIKAADAFVLPSFHEGFGMPLVEALSHGVPVLCSDAGALPEVSGGLALGFKAGDARSINTALDRFVAEYREGKIATDSGTFAMAEWHARVREYAAQFSRQAFVERSVDRVGAMLARTAYCSESYRAQLTEIVHSVLPARDIHAEDAQDCAPLASWSDRLEATVHGAMLWSELRNRRNDDDRAILKALLKWPFIGDQSDADLDYWVSEVNELGLMKILERLSHSPEVQRSPARLAAGLHVKSAICELAMTRTVSDNPRETQGPERLGLDHPVIALLIGSPVSTADFVKQLFRLVLGREHEENGFGAYFDAIESGAMSRRMVAAEVLASEEYENFVADRAADSGRR